MKIMLAIPEEDNCISEISKFLKSEADLYVFPEGFLNNDTIDDALNIIKNTHSCVITGFKDNHKNGQQKALVIENGVITDTYTKCILTKGEKEKGKERGSSIHCVKTRFGVIGIPICYEIHFPEVPRVMMLDKPLFLLNIIGTGMYHELQYEQWITIAKTRAIENEIFVLGCSHYCGQIPLAFAFSSSGQCISQKKNTSGSIIVEIDLKECNKKIIGYWDDRVPELFPELSRENQ